MSLELRNVTKSYREPGGGRLPVLSISEFQLSAGEQVVLVGSSGGGKTTLLNIIAGITSADSGEVRVGGTNLASLPEVTREINSGLNGSVTSSRHSTCCRRLRRWKTCCWG